MGWGYWAGMVAERWSISTFGEEKSMDSIGKTELDCTLAERCPRRWAGLAELFQEPAHSWIELGAPHTILLEPVRLRRPRPVQQPKRWSLLCANRNCGS